MDNFSKKDIKIGMLVDIELDGNNSEVIRGHIEQILSKTVGNKGIKVCLKNGKIGRIINIPKDYEINVERIRNAI